MGEAVAVGERLRGSIGVFEEKTLPNVVNVKVNSNPLLKRLLRRLLIYLTVVLVCSIYVHKFIIEYHMVFFGGGGEGNSLRSRRAM